MFVAAMSVLLAARAGIPAQSAVATLRPRIVTAATTVSGIPDLRTLRDLGRAPASTTVSLAVMLPYRHANELQPLIEMQADPASPYYRRFLSNEQFANYFSPAPAEELRVRSALQNAGFRIVTTYSNRTVIDIEAPARVAERYFQTEIHTVNQAGHGLRYANVRPALVPAGLRGEISYVTGFDNTIKYTTSLQQLSPERRAALRLRGIEAEASSASPPGPLQGTRIAGFHVGENRVRATATAMPTPVP